jgi:hypothetical protein
MVLLDELRDRGLIGKEEEFGSKFDGLTETGKALMVAKATCRTDKAKAWKVLKTFLQACADVNARTDLPFDVREVWLFGRMIDDSKNDVVDIDIGPVFGHPERYDEFKERRARFEELAEEMGGAALFRNAGIMAPFRAQSYVINQLLYGGPQASSSCSQRYGQLLSLGCPCKLVFDKMRGEIDDLVLPRHPQSPGTANDIGARREMPDLLANRKPLRPLPADLTGPGWFRYDAIVQTGPWPERLAIPMDSEQAKRHRNNHGRPASIGKSPAQCRNPKTEPRKFERQNAVCASGVPACLSQT